ncbi:MAG: LysR family transcriptional regulator [Bacillaceae bacterium]
MDFNWLTTFLTAVKYGTFRKTAEVLYISQPSVTVHIHKLEKELGVALFQKDGRNMKLTEEGKRYVPIAEHLINTHQKGLAEIKALSQGYTTTLALAISPLLADTILPHVLKQFITTYPHIQLSVSVLASVEMEQLIVNEEIDIALTCINTINSELISDILYTDNIKLITLHDGYDPEFAPSLTEEEVLTNNYLLIDNHPVYWDSLTRAIKSKFPTIKMMKVSQIYITKRFIANGLGVSFLPASTVRRELMEGWFLEVPCSSIKLPTINIYGLMKYKHSKQKLFLDFLANYTI